MLRSPHIASLTPNYLFPEVNKKVESFLKLHPEANLISLGIGDTTHPIPPLVAGAIAEKAQSMGTRKGYSGYGTSWGGPAFRALVSDKIYQGLLAPQEITISDGIKPDMARFALLTGGKQKVAIQDPAYPVYLESSILAGNEITLLPANEENGFFPRLVFFKRTLHSVYLLSQ